MSPHGSSSSMSPCLCFCQTPLTIFFIPWLPLLLSCVSILRSSPGDYPDSVCLDSLACVDTDLALTLLSPLLPRLSASLLSGPITVTQTQASCFMQSSVWVWNYLFTRLALKTDVRRKTLKTNQYLSWVSRCFVVWFRVPFLEPSPSAEEIHLASLVV